MYNCSVCTSPSVPNAKLLKIVSYVVVNGRRQIEKEMPACRLCYDGYHKGIPLDLLAKMHRPVVTPPGSPDPGRSPGHPPASLSPIRPGGASTSPKEQGPLSQALTEAFNRLSKDRSPITTLEERGKKYSKNKPKVKYENRKAKGSRAKGKQTGGKVP